MMLLGISLVLRIALLSSADVGQDPNLAERNLTGQSETIRQQIERQRFSAIEPNEPTRSDALKEVVNRLQSLQLSADFKPLPAAGPIEKTKKDNPDAKPAVSIQPESIVSEEVDLDEIQKPVNAMAAANALYRANDYRRAVRFYEMAAKAAEAADPSGRQWALYQIANCLRHEDKEKAIAAYQQMIKEYPSSSWANAALIQQKNLEWLKKNQPVLSKTNDPNQS
jgi:tetratricopeptide (TPR) repeat protein